MAEEPHIRNQSQFQGERSDLIPGARIDSNQERPGKYAIANDLGLQTSFTDTASYQIYRIP
jgi:hypothetical protein